MGMTYIDLVCWISVGWSYSEEFTVSYVKKFIDGLKWKKNVVNSVTVVNSGSSCCKELTIPILTYISNNYIRILTKDMSNRYLRLLFLVRKPKLFDKSLIIRPLCFQYKNYSNFYTFIYKSSNKS